MLTRRDVLNNLKKSGVRELSAIKQGCRGFEDHMAAYYGFEIVKRMKARSNSLLPAGSLGELMTKYPLPSVDVDFLA